MFSGRKMDSIVTLLKGSNVKMIGTLINNRGGNNQRKTEIITLNGFRQNQFYHLIIVQKQIILHT